jgi:hypothetical protein
MRGVVVLVSGLLILTSDYPGSAQTVTFKFDPPDSVTFSVRTTRSEQSALYEQERVTQSSRTFDMIKTDDGWELTSAPADTIWSDGYDVSFPTIRELLTASSTITLSSSGRAVEIALNSDYASLGLPQGSKDANSRTRLDDLIRLLQEQHVTKWNRLIYPLSGERLSRDDVLYRYFPAASGMDVLFAPAQFAAFMLADTMTVAGASCARVLIWVESSLPALLRAVGADSSDIPAELLQQDVEVVPGSISGAYEEWEQLLAEVRPQVPAEDDYQLTGRDRAVFVDLVLETNTMLVRSERMIERTVTTVETPQGTFGEVAATVTTAREVVYDR